jgi:hypothetical protein
LLITVTHYNTQHVLAAGDFNAILEPEDSSSREIRKKVTSAALHSMIDRHHLIDLAIKSNKLGTHMVQKRNRIPVIKN